MSFLSTLFGKQDRYLSLLEASASESRTGVQQLEKVLRKGSDPQAVNEILECRTEASRVTQEIDECLCEGLKGPFDPEEIETLARALSRISSGVKKFATRYSICARHLGQGEFDRQRELLVEATETVCQMVSGLRSLSLNRTQAQHEKLQALEANADRVFVDSLMDLYQKRPAPMQAIMLRDLYELLENIIDRCRTAGNLMLRIALKHT